MNYIFKNYRYFIKNECTIFFMVILCVIVSSLILHFSYGVYQNMHSGFSAHKPVFETEENRVDFTFTEDIKNQVTKGELDQCLEQVSNTMDIIQSYGNSDSTLFTAYEYLDWNFPRHEACTSVVTVTADGIKAPKQVFDNLRRGDSFYDGGKWTDRQEAEGDRVCLFPYYELTEQGSTDDNGVSYPPVFTALNDDGTLTINGEIYQVAGHLLMAITPIVCYGSLAKDTPIVRGSFYFEEGVTGNTFQHITDIFESTLGKDRVTVDDSCSYRTDIHYTYRTALIMIVILGIVAAINYMILYSYLLRRRRREIAILRICGMTRWKGILLSVTECMLLTVPFYVLAAVIYAFYILPKIRIYFTLMQQAYSIWIYMALFGIYFGISLLVCLIGVTIQNKRSIRMGVCK